MFGRGGHGVVDDGQDDHEGEQAGQGVAHLLPTGRWQHEHLEAEYDNMYNLQSCQRPHKKA